MPINILMPALSPTMEKGDLSKRLALPSVAEVVEAAKAARYR